MDNLDAAGRCGVRPEPGTPVWTMLDGTHVQGRRYPCAEAGCCPYDRARRIPCDVGGWCPASPKPEGRIRDGDGALTPRASVP